MKFGVDYYPEHWPRERWEEDARLMREAGMEVVRMAEFSWAKMEPELGVFDFAWLDEAIEVLGKEGIKIVLGTPTATPPIWIIERNPEILPVNLDGTKLGFGGRHHCCQSNSVYRNHIGRFVRTMARHFSGNPHVIGWQTDNEFGNSHQRLCACDSCKGRFHQWLEQKYQTIDKLNEAWGTVFWSQTYSRFDQIPVPLPTPNSHNPGMLLDWKRHASDLIVDFQKVQLKILREECPHQFITHNYMGFFDKTDYFDLAKDLDFVSHDQYPRHYKEGRELSVPAHKLAAALDLIRGTKQQTFWVMEQQAGPSGWETISTTPRPGQLRLWTYQSVAHGADTIVYFRWRTCLFGTEEYWHGILPHSGIPGRRYDEIGQTVRELSSVMDRFKGGLLGAEVGILFSYDQQWALQIQPHHPELDYVKHLQGYYKALFDANIPVDMVSEQEDFSRYKVLVAPLLFLMTPELSKKLESYVAGGGHLVLTMRTGVKDWNNAVQPWTLPGDLSSVLGIEIHDYDCLREVEQSVRWIKAGAETPVEAAAKWCDIITLSGAEAWAVYGQDYYRDTPAITRHGYEQGAAYYVGTELDELLMETFIRQVAAEADVKPLAAAPEGVEISVRKGAEADYLFVMNHQPDLAEISIPDGWSYLTGDGEAGNKLYLPGYGAAIYEQLRK